MRFNFVTSRISDPSGWHTTGCGPFGTGWSALSFTDDASQLATYARKRRGCRFVPELFIEFMRTTSGDQRSTLGFGCRSPEPGHRPTTAISPTSATRARLSSSYARPLPRAGRPPWPATGPFASRTPVARDPSSPHPSGLVAAVRRWMHAG